MLKILEEYNSNLESSEQFLEKCTTHSTAQHRAAQHSTAQHSTENGVAKHRDEFLEEYTLLDPTRSKMSEMCVFSLVRHFR